MTRSSRSGAGFVLADLVLSLGLGAALLSAAWSGPSGGHGAGLDIAANERGAIGALRRIAAAQAALATSAAIDTDDDGVGEYGFLGELAGRARLRVYDPASDGPAIGDSTLTTPLLPPDFGHFLIDSRVEDVLVRNGYYFKMFLPDAAFFLPDGQTLDVAGIAEDGNPSTGGSAGALFPDPDNGEDLWCCYAWPVEAQVTGNRAFFVNQEGRILQTANDGHSRGPLYEGLVSPAEHDAALSDAPGTNGVTGMGAPLGIPPRRASDGNRWIPIGR